MKDSPNIFSSSDDDSSLARDGKLEVTSEFIRPPFKLLVQLAREGRGLKRREKGVHFQVW